MQPDYTAYTSTNEETVPQAPSFRGQGLTYVPNFLYYVAIANSTRPMSGHVYPSRKEARAARRILTENFPNRTFKMYRVTVNSDCSRTS